MTSERPTNLQEIQALDFSKDNERYKQATYDELKKKALDLLALEARCERLTEELEAATKAKNKVKSYVIGVMESHKLGTFRVQGIRVSLTPRGLHYTEE